MKGKIDLELIKVVFQDLDYLIIELNKVIDDANLRRISPVLRRLLIHQELAEACNMLGINVKIYAPRNAEKINELNLDFTTFQSGGAKFKGFQADNIFFKAGEYINDKGKVMEIFNEFKKLNTEKVPLSVDEFLNQISFIIDKVKISRADVIKYVANKLGGTHYDKSRKLNSKKANINKKFILLDSIRNKIKLVDKETIYYEFLSIGQFVINSPDVKRFVEIMRPQFSIKNL